MAFEKILNVIDKVLTYSIAMCCIGILATSTFFIWDSLIQIRQTTADYYREYREMIIEENGNYNFDSLREINPDITGWLTLYDTGIDYPILQNREDFNYLNRDFRGETNLTGSIYLQEDESIEDEVLVLFGHHISDGSMFGQLDEYQDPAYFNEHIEGELITDTGKYNLRVLALVSTDAYDPIYRYDISHLEDLQVVTGSLEDIEADKLLFLSTCTSSGGIERTILIVEGEAV